MKILIVRTFPNILKSGSYNIQEIGLAKALTRAGVQADIVLYNGMGPDRTELEEVDEDTYISIYHLHGYNLLKNGFFPSLKRIASGYDVIQVHEYDQITSWMYYTGKLKNKVVIYHGPYFHEFNKGYNLKCKVFDKTFLKLRNNDEVISFVKSNAAGEFLKSKGFLNVFPVGVGLDSAVFDLEVPQDSFGSLLGEDKGAEVGLDKTGMSGASKSDRAGFTWIYVGKIEPRRNSVMLLKLIDELLSAHDDMNMILVGDGEVAYVNEVLAPVRKWIASGRIDYRPKATQIELAGLYRKADCMLFPSNYEIFGMVLMEAMYLELPIISSNNGGADMLLRNEENGIIVDDFSIASWRAAAERMYTDAALRARIKSSLKVDRLGLGWDVVAEKMLKIYKLAGMMKE